LAETSSGFTLDLTIAGANCQAFGNDIPELVLEVQYQTKERLNVKISPKYIVAANSTRYILPADLVLEPAWDGQTTAQTSDLNITWTNEGGSFQFKINRISTDEELFSTYGHVIVFEDQFIELVTNMIEVRTLSYRLMEHY